jgi:uncharacterized membrane protein YeaQ/YmgE (transglycosylase-associated protein family)
MINIIVWLILGAILGVVAYLIDKRRKRNVLLLMVGVGIFGAFIGGWFISPLLTIAVMEESQFNFSALIVALVVSVISLAIASFARRGTVR